MKSDTFKESEVRTVVTMWTGNASFKTDQQGGITQMDLSCSIDLPPMKSDSMFLMIKHFIKSYEFIRIKHSNRSIHLSITLRPNTLKDFYILNHRIKKIHRVKLDRPEEKNTQPTVHA